MTDFYATSKYVKELQPSDFDEIDTWRLKDKSCTAVLFYCHWCGYCQKVKDVWEQLGRKAAFMKVAAFHCAAHPEHTEKIKYDMPQLVTSYPTITMYKDGEPLEAYEGDRTLASLMEMCMRVCSAGRLSSDSGNCSSNSQSCSSQSGCSSP